MLPSGREIAPVRAHHVRFWSEAGAMMHRPAAPRLCEARAVYSGDLPKRQRQARLRGVPVVASGSHHWPPPATAGHWRGCSPRPGCRGGPRRAPGGGGPGCPHPAPGPPDHPQVRQVDGEVVRRGQGVGVVVAEHPAAAGQDVLIQLAGRLIIPSARRSIGEVLAEAKVLGWSSPSTRRRPARVSSSSSRAA